MQEILVLPLDADFADLGRAGVIGRVDSVQVVLADRAHVAQGMGGDLPARIFPSQSGLDVDARKGGPAHGEPGGFLRAEPVSQDRGLKAPLAANLGPDPGQFLRLDQPELSEPGEGLLDVGDLLGDQFELVDGTVLRDDPAGPVEDQPPHRRHGLQPDPDARYANLGEVRVLRHVFRVEHRTVRREWTLLRKTAMSLTSTT